MQITAVLSNDFDIIYDAKKGGTLFEIPKASVSTGVWSQTIYKNDSVFPKQYNDCIIELSYSSYISVVILREDGSILYSLGNGSSNGGVDHILKINGSTIVDQFVVPAGSYHTSNTMKLIFLKSEQKFYININDSLIYEIIDTDINSGCYIASIVNYSGVFYPSFVYNIAKVVNTDDEYVFNYTGVVQTFVVPQSGLYKLECWGASGGRNESFSNNYGGKGGYSVGSTILNKGDILYIYAGGAGGTNSSTGGWNGGGTGTYSSGGGGASDIRKNSTTLVDRIIVAGGGGAGSHTGSGGDGGGLIGNNSSNNYETGGTQTAGGTGYASNGYFGLGGNSSSHGGPGGGGWYGGGGGHSCAFAGGGGSGYIGALKNAITVSGGEQMPSIISGTTMIGNIGNGFAKITFLKPFKNMQHFYIECDNKKYIPTKQFWNDNLNGFIPVEDYVLKDLENDSREFMLDVTDLLKPFEVNGRLIIPIDSFKNKKFKVYKFIGLNKNWALTGADNINGLNNNINLSYKIKNSILGKSFIKLIEYIRDFDFKKYDYKLKSDCPNIKIGLFHNGEYYGKDFKVILKDDIINNGFDINKLNGIEIPFKDFKIIAVMTGNEYLNQIKLYKKLRPVSKLIDKKRYKIYYDNIQKRIYIIFDSGKIRNLTVNKLGKHEETFGIINSLEDIKERI